MNLLGTTFAAVMGKLAYSDLSSGYILIPQDRASAAFAGALAQAGLSADAALDLSQAAQRAQIFAVLEGAIGTLERNLATSFAARTTTAL